MATKRTKKKLQKFQMKSGSFSQMVVGKDGKETRVKYKAGDVFEADPATLPKGAMDIIAPFVEPKKPVVETIEEIEEDEEETDEQEDD